MLIVNSLNNISLFQALARY